MSIIFWSCQVIKIYPFIIFFNLKAAYGLDRFYTYIFEKRSIYYQTSLSNTLKHTDARQKSHLQA